MVHLSGCRGRTKAVRHFGLFAFASAPCLLSPFSLWAGVDFSSTESFGCHPSGGNQRGRVPALLFLFRNNPVGTDFNYHACAQPPDDGSLNNFGAFSSSSVYNQLLSACYRTHPGPWHYSIRFVAGRCDTFNRTGP